MTDTVAQMSQDEFRFMIESIVKKTIQQEFHRVLRDPDSGLEIRDDIAAQLRHQAELVAKGDMGRDFDDVIAELGLE